MLEMGEVESRNVESRKVECWILEVSLFSFGGLANDVYLVLVFATVQISKGNPESRKSESR